MWSNTVDESYPKLCGAVCFKIFAFSCCKRIDFPPFRLRRHVKQFSTLYASFLVLGGHSSNERAAKSFYFVERTRAPTIFKCFGEFLKTQIDLRCGSFTFTPARFPNRTSDPWNASPSAKPIYPAELRISFFLYRVAFSERHLCCIVRRYLP